MNIRNFRWDDLPALADLMNRHAEAYGRTSRITVEQIERVWRAPYNHPEQTAFVAVESDGIMLGYTIADLFDEPNQAFGVYQVLPGHPEVGKALMEAATEHFKSVAFANSPPDMQISMDWRVSEQDTEAIGLCEAQGYEQVRQFYTMRIALDQQISPTSLPEGFTLRPFAPEHLTTVYEAKVDIFQDHWGGQHDPLSEWESDIARPDFDPSLWWIAYAEDGSVAGMVLSQPASDTTGYVGIVGVRRAARKKGLAQALLQICFAEYQRRGFGFVHLGVDSNSQTNAVALYQRVGMHIHQTILYYRAVLREGTHPTTS